MGKSSRRAIGILIAFLAVMFASYWFLPEIPRMRPHYSSWVLSGCWIFATVGSLIPSAVKQQFLSDRFWYVLIVVSTIGTWSGFILLYAVFDYAGTEDSNFPGLGSLLFLLAAASFGGILSFVIGWFVPSQAGIRRQSPG